jgi:uncharacterized repeat protein (TIGR01451 family)
VALAAMAGGAAFPVTALAGSPPANTSPVTIGGTARQGQQLAADRGQWDGTEPITYTYRWRRCTTTDSPCVDIPGADGETLKLTAADVGAKVVVAVTADNSTLPGGGTATATSTPTAPVASASTPPGDPVIAAAGDIACDPRDSSFNGGFGASTACRQMYTSDLLVGGGLAAVVALGDNQYECAGFNAFRDAYDPSWGRVKSITRPAVGNHEYNASGGTDCDTTAKAKGHFDYFNGRNNFSGPAGERTKAYYSYDIGAWHLIALNSMCNTVGGCGAGSQQEVWLRNDLASHPSSCTLAYWHHPDLPPSLPLWADLYAARADIVLNGHEHNYQRFAPQTDTIATYDPEAGIRKFVIGTGGRSVGPFSPSLNIEVYDDQTFGVLRLTLHPLSYDWQFVPEADAGFTDSGSAFCHKGLAASADLSLAASDAPDPVPPGQLLTYTLTARNDGPASAGGATVKDTLPPGVTYDSAVPSQGTCSESGGTVDCALGALSSGSSATIDVTVRPQSEGSLTNRAAVSSPVADADPTNNDATADTAVIASADLSLAQSDAPDPVQFGQDVTYSLTAQNLGPSDTADVILTDNLPVGVTYDSATPSQGTCSESGGTVDCALGALSSGSSATVAVKVRPQSQGNLTNQADVASAVADPNPANNSAAADTTVSAPAGYPRPVSATPVRVSLVPAYAACTNPNASHGPPLEQPSCEPPAQASGYLTVGTSDANGAAPNSVGTVRMAARVNQSPASNDVLITANLTDVRCQIWEGSCGLLNTAGGPDYTGELSAGASLRLTDKLNGATGPEAGTVADTSISATVPCEATADPSVGAVCSLTTSANTLLPNYVQNGARAVWELGRVEVFDGGPDGVVSTADNSLFADQGIFVP